MVRLSGQMFNFKSPRQSALFQPEQPRIGNLIQCLITEDFQQGFVISDDQQIITALSKVTRLLEASGDG